METNLGLSPGQCRDSLESRRLGELVDKIEGLDSGGSHHGGEVEVSGGAWLDPHLPPQTEHRIEHPARGVRQGTIDCGGVVDLVSAAEKPGPIRFILNPTDYLACDREDMTCPHRLLLVRAWSAAGEQRVASGHHLGLHEEIGESRVSGIGPGRCQNNLGVGGDLHFSGHRAQICEAHSTDLGVVLFGHHHSQPGGDVAVTTRDLCLVFAEGHLVGIGLGQCRLIPGRPGASRPVPDEEVAAEVVASGVFPPAVDGQPLPLAVTGTGGGDDGAETAVGQGMSGRARAMWRRDPTDHTLRLFQGMGRLGDLLGTGTGHLHIAGNPFMQQQLGRPDPRVRMKEVPAEPGKDDVGHGDQ